MRSWIPWIAGAVLLAAVIVVLGQQANRRAKEEAKPDDNTLVGKRAPDFEGDFALNGTPVRLSSLRGKVVLVDFWAVWCPPCIKTFTHLREWNSKYKSAGLEVVGVTMYNFENGRFLGFNKETGKLKNLDDATKQTEQAMLKEFAEYHKLHYLLMPLPKRDVRKTFMDYDVDGIPQVVLIDRKGIIRMVRVGADPENAVEIEREMRILLNEKG